MTNLIQKHQQDIEKICQEEGISYLAIFGSHARGEDTPNSDIDLLVEYQPQNDVGISHILRTEKRLEQLFRKKVDLVPKDSLDKYIAPYIQDDLKTIYA